MIIRDTTLGSFEQWAELVAGPVEWLVGLNPVTLIEERKREDPRRGDERAVITALAAWQATRTSGPWWPAKEAVGGIDADRWASVIKAKGERPNSRQVGNWLRARRDRVFTDLQLAGRLDRTGVMEWTIRSLQGLQGLAGSALYQPRGNGRECEPDKSEDTNRDRPCQPLQTQHPGGSSEPDDEEFEL
jgi:hypothetical protein